MSGISFDVRITRNLIPRVTRDTKTAITRAVKTCALDCARTASESAPHKTGDLEKAYALTPDNTGNIIAQKVEFSVFKGGFNYAIAMHEWVYNLGAGSLAKSGGTGMSGATYSVGRKYLTRVLEGEADTYTEYIKRKILEQLSN